MRPDDPKSEESEYLEIVVSAATFPPRSASFSRYMEKNTNFSLVVGQL